MKEFLKNNIECLVAIFIIAMMFVIFIADAIAHKENMEKEYQEYYKKGYIDACKDFHKSKLKYDLVENEDGTREWKRIEK